ncbi:MAG: response regulator [Candidatus Anammoxibacter sp.]
MNNSISPQTGKKRILVVDDVPSNIGLLSEGLKSEYTVIAAKSGQMALDRVFSENPPDLILLDIDMPEMDGYQVCRSLKENPDTRDIPVMFLSAMEEVQDKTKGFKLGAVDYITKPFDIMEVKARIETHLAFKQAREDLEKAKEDSEAASKAKSEFLVNMSHEIRTPLNGIIGLTELLLETEMTTRQHDYIMGIQRSSDGLLTIINDILDFSKILAEKMVLEPIPFDLRASVEDIALLLSVQANRKGINLILRYAPDAPQRVIGDAGRIRQILTNLVGNANKFTHEGSVVIDVQYDSHGDEKGLFKFSVEDSGIGIDPDNIKYIFDKFSQEDTSTTRKYGGTGLGLSICKKLVELMEGEISVESKLGKGSVFLFTIPLPLDKCPALAEETGKRDFEGLRILIVDDNSINRQIYLELLASWKIGCEAVDNGQEALHRLRAKAEENEPFQIALLDFFMPGMDGETLGKAIKTDPLIRKTLLIMSTSGSRPGAAKYLEGLGFTAYLEKPILRNHLLETLSIIWNDCKMGKSTGIISEQALKELRIKEDSKEPKIKDQKVEVHAYVLLVEDNVVNQDVALENLKQMGCTMELAKDGSEAVEKVKNNNYDLVLMDCQMPIMDGFEATREIRNHEQGGNHVPIVAMTANALKGDRELCIDAGMDDYISKPFRHKDMLEVLLKYCKTKVYIPSSTIKILVVDEEKGTLELTAKTLMERFPSALIKTTNNTIKACVLIGSFSPNILITDVSVSGIDSVEIVKFIRGEQCHKKINIVVFARLENNDKSIQSLRHLSVEDIIQKPDYVSLISAIDRFCNPSVNKASSSQHSSESTNGETDTHKPVFSISDTLALVGGNVKRMKRLVDITLEDSKKQIEQLRSSLAADDLSVLERAAHTLKGQAANFGAEPFMEFAQRIEQAAKDGDAQSVHNMMKDFDTEYERLLKALEEIDWNRVK